MSNDGAEVRNTKSAIQFADWAEAFDSVEVGIVIISADLQLEYVNAAYRKIVDIPDYLTAGSSARDLFFYLASRGDFGGCDPQAETDKWLATFDQKDWQDIDREISNGRVVRTRRSKINTDFFLATITDITNFKNNESLVSSVLDATDQAIIITGATGHVELINKAYTNLFDFHEQPEPEKLSYKSLMLSAWEGGKFCGNFFGDDVNTLSPAQFATRAVKFGEMALEKPLTVQLSSGTYVKFSVSHMNAGRKIYTFSDITDGIEREKSLKTAQLSAELADRSKSEFLANMSHEIRTPMNGLMGMAELLSNTRLDSQQTSLVETIMSSSGALLTIINDILDFSKIEAGKLELDLSSFNLRDTIEDVAALIAPGIIGKDIELIVRVQPELVNQVIGDVGRFRQVLTNLLGNAVKFTSSGHVFVNLSGTLSDKGLELECFVQDTGVGIAEHQVDYIFEKFSQVDASSTRPHEGTGLGLAIASRLVALMDGRIGCKSVVGEGSTFWFTALMQPENKITPELEIPGEMSGKRILAIDDNAICRSILREQFAAWDLKGETVANASEGLDKLHQAQSEELPFDLIILDNQMPDQNGMEVARLIRSDERLNFIPIIMLNSVDSMIAIRHSEDLLHDAQLTKPARASKLLEAIGNTIQNVTVHNDGSIIAKVAPSAIAAQSARVEPELEQPASVEGDQWPAKENDVRILITEDNELNQIVFSQILKHMNIRFELANNGQQAIEAIDKYRPPLVLMDVSMPIMNGLEATKQIRTMFANEGLQPIYRPIIIGITAHAYNDDKAMCMAAGMDDYMSKPVSPDLLAEKILRWLPDNQSPIRGRADG